MYVVILRSKIIKWYRYEWVSIRYQEVAMMYLRQDHLKARHGARWRSLQLTSPDKMVENKDLRQTIPVVRLDVFEECISSHQAVDIAIHPGLDLYCLWRCVSCLLLLYREVLQQKLGFHFSRAKGALIDHTVITLYTCDVSFRMRMIIKKRFR